METEKSYDVVILYSGGADSRLLLHFALQLEKRPFCVLVNYGQKHLEELQYAIRQLKQLRVDWKVVEITNLGLNSGLTGDLIEGRFEGVSNVNVPARNTMLISVAYAIAENLGIDEIWYGADYSDRENLFPDCYQEYVFKMNELLEIAPARPIKLVAPLLGWTKNMILYYLDMMGVERDEVYSGYEKPREKFEFEDTDF